MNKCIESEIQAMLPDMLHDTLTAAEKSRVEAHVARCEECEEDLEVLRKVKRSTVFTPSIDIDKIIRRIPPYQIIPPPLERPVELPVEHPLERPRIASWLAAASLVLVAVVGGSMLLVRSDSREPTTAATITSQPAIVIPAPEIANAGSRTPALALASGVEELSDGSLVQLMSEMNGFDALPATDPEPVLAVDTTDGFNQD